MLNELRKVYLSYDTFHLIKNVQNNLLNHKQLLFPPCTFDGFKGSINITGGVLKRKMLHDVFERDAQLDGNLKKAPKVTLKVLRPSSSKQNVPLAPAMFDETTSAAVQWYFPQHSSAAEFLQLFQKWWIISNSKSQFSTTNYLGNAAVLSSLIEDLLEERYEVVLTSRFQSDSKEQQFAQYRQISGRRFLVGLKRVTSSEKNLKIKSLLKEEINRV